jgi:hypothetical protein
MVEIVSYNPLLRKVLFVFTILVLVFSNIAINQADASGQLPASITLAAHVENPVDQLPEGTDPGKPIRAIVQFIDPPLASYRGSLPGLSATSPRVTGSSKLDTESSDSQAYLQYLDNEHSNFTQVLNSVVPGALVERSYKLALNGVVVKTTAGSLNSLRGLPGVKSVTLEKHFKPNLDAVIPLIGLGTG